MILSLHRREVQDFCRCTAEKYKILSLRRQEIHDFVAAPPGSTHLAATLPIHRRARNQEETVQFYRIAV
jgi:hypothetical protein